MGEFLRSFGLLRAVDDSAMTVEAVISTGNIARDQMIIDPDGWDFTNYRRNPVVLWGHDDLAMPVARTIGEIKKTTTELIATAEFDKEDPEAVRIFGKIKRGYVNTTSVRWLPKRTEIRAIPTEHGDRDTLVFVEQELLEWSFVSIPADPGAMILRGDGSGFDLDAALAAARGDTPPPMISALDELRTSAEAITEYLDGYTSIDDLDDEARALLRDLQTRIAPVLTERPVIAGRDDARLLAGVAEITRELREAATPLDIDRLVVAGIAKATGKTEERVRAERAGGNA